MAIDVALVALQAKVANAPMPVTMARVQEVNVAPARKALLTFQIVMEKHGLPSYDLFAGRCRRQARPAPVSCMPYGHVVAYLPTVHTVALAHAFHVGHDA